MSWIGLVKDQTSIQLRILKTAVYELNPSKYKELEQFYFEEWAKIPVVRCAKLIETYPKRLTFVIAAKVGST